MNTNSNNTTNVEELTAITGSGGGGGKGGGGGGRAAVEAANTLRSSASVSIVEVISEGEIVGICGGAKGIYLNDTPLMSSSGAYNFARAAWDYRVGLPSQPYMKGFSAASSEIVVGAPLTVLAGPVVRTTSSGLIDAVKVTILLPSGLFVQNTTNGDMSGTKVSFSIERKLSSSGSWEAATTYTIDGKTTSPYERQYRIQRPVGSGTWDVRVTRITADDASSAVHSATTFSRITEIQEVKDHTTEYNNTAVVGLVIDAETVGNTIPTRSYLVKGIKVQVPSNYDPTTRQYTGIWDGTFQTAWSDNPAWVLYDLLTNTRYGMGEFISASQIDKFSFYDAAVYNDGIVPDGVGGHEPRYTFNCVINARDDAFRILQTVAGAMRATVIDFNGLITVLQDRPSSPVKLITKANVLYGNFEYKSSGLFERHTAFNVTFNDKTDRHLQKVVTIDATTQSGAFQTALTAAQAKYGYNPIDIAAYGCTSEGQALRHGRWAVDTEINQTELVQFKMSLNGFDLLPGDVVKLYDEDYAATVGAGRIKSVSGTTVTLDRQVNLTPGSTIDVTLADGFTIETRSITVPVGSSLTDTFAVVSPFSQSVLEGADYIVTTLVQPRQFKILAIKQEAANVINVEAVLYDPNKFERVETGVSVAAPIFSNALVTVCSAPASITFREVAVNVDNTIKRSLLISWQQPTQGIAAYYTLTYRVNSGNWTTVANLKTLSHELVNIQAGTFEVKIFAHSTFGNQSQETSGTYSIVTAGSGTSILNPPTNLVEQNLGGSAYNTPDLNFKWTNPSSNSSVVGTTLRDFEVRVVEVSGSTIIRTFYVPPVAAGSTQSSSYTYSMNAADTNNAPSRHIQIEVRCRDTSGNLSTPVITVFTNDAPALPSSIAFTGGLQTTRLTFTLPTDPDFKGVLVWGSTSTGFTPSSSTLLYDGVNSYISFNALDDQTTYYYRIATYDSFGKSYTGAGLNISTEYAVTTAPAVGVPKGATLPPTTVDPSIPGSPSSAPVEGDVFFNTTDGKLYRFHSGAWTTAVDGADILSNSITAGKIAAATITSSEIAAGTIIGSNISAGAITGDRIAAGTITSNEIAAGTITATNIAVGTITSSEIATNTITTDRLTVNAATAANQANVVGGHTYFASTDYNKYLSPINILSFTSTGAPVTGIGYVEIWLDLLNTTLATTRLQVQLRWNGTIVDTYDLGNALNVYYFEPRGLEIRVPIAFRHVPPAGTHIYSFDVFVQWQQADGAINVPCNGGGISRNCFLSVQENKV